MYPKCITSYFPGLHKIKILKVAFSVLEGFSDTKHMFITRPKAIFSKPQN